MNAIQLVTDNLEEFGEYTLLHFEGESFTNVQVNDRAQQLATVLADHGVGVGDHVIVMMPNSPDVGCAFQAIWRLGAVIMPITPMLGPNEVHYLLEDSEAAVAVTLPTIAPGLGQASQGVATFRHLLVIGETDAPGGENIAPLIAAATPTSEIVDRADDELAVLLYTSGTTGPPKGVMLTHFNIVENARSVKQLKADVDPESVGLGVLPLSHSFGILMMNLGLIYGTSSVIMPSFDVEKVFQAIERYRVTTVPLVPTMMTYMLNFPDRDSYDTSSLDEVVSGGAALPEEVRLEMERVFDCRVKDGFGMSECTTSVCGYHHDDVHRPGSVGKAIPGVELRIVDPDDKPLPAGEEGEICVRGPNIMKGYWKKEEETRLAVRNGWMHSGDLGRLDDDGYLFITGRIKDLIIKGGENISANELEDVIHKHPGVADVAVVGVPDAKYGEDIWALVVPRHDQTVTEDEIKEHAGQHVTKFKIPHAVYFMPMIPKNPTGKIQKRAIKEQLKSMAEAASSK